MVKIKLLCKGDELSYITNAKFRTLCHVDRRSRREKDDDTLITNLMCAEIRKRRKTNKFNEPDYRVLFDSGIFLFHAVLIYLLLHLVLTRHNKVS